MATTVKQSGAGTSKVVTTDSSGNFDLATFSVSTMTDARTPTAHASTHASAGSDPVTLAQSQVTNLTSDLAGKAATSHTHAQSDVTGLTAALAATASHVLKRKASDESVTSSTSFQDDNDFTFSIGASEVWAVQINAIADFQAGGFKREWTLPASATIIETVTANNQAGNNDAYYSASAAGSTVTLTNGIGAFMPVVFNTVITNSTNAGTVTLRWAQNVSNGTATALKAGSYLVAHKIA